MRIRPITTFLLQYKCDFVVAIQERSVILTWGQCTKRDVCNCWTDLMLDAQRKNAWWELRRSSISDRANIPLHYTWHQCRSKYPGRSVPLLTCTLACKIQQFPLCRYTTKARIQRALRHHSEEVSWLCSLVAVEKKHRHWYLAVQPWALQMHVFVYLHFFYCGTFCGEL